MELFEALRAYRERILEEDGDPDGLPDKKGLIADFRTQRDASRVVGFHLNLHLGEAPKASTAPLSSLQPILLRQASTTPMCIPYVHAAFATRSGGRGMVA